MVALRSALPNASAPSRNGSSDTQRDNCRVVAAISAMAGVTDNLIKLAQSVSPNPTQREMDILLATGEHGSSALVAMAVNALGGRAISVTGAQAGILTDRVHTKAKIANITPRQIQELLADDYIVIVAGFQGQRPKAKRRRSDAAAPI